MLPDSYIRALGDAVREVGGLLVPCLRQTPGGMRSTVQLVPGLEQKRF